MSYQFHPAKGQVSYHVECFVSRTFVFKTEMVANGSIGTKHQQVLVRDSQS